MRHLHASILSVCVLVLASIFETCAQETALFIDSQAVSVFPACSASFATPCAFNNVYRLVEGLAEELDIASDEASVLSSVNDKAFNIAGGFAPYVFEASSMLCLANGRNANYTGLSIEAVATSLSVLVSQEGLSEEILQVVNGAQGAGWLQYAFVSEDEVFPAPINHVMYARSVTGPSGTTYVVFAGLAQRSLPRMDVDACPVSVNRRCSITNVRSLVGNALSRAITAQTDSELRALWNEITYPVDNTFSEGAWYVFAARFHGPAGTNVMVAQNDPTWIGRTTFELFADSVPPSYFNGSVLQTSFSEAAAAGGGWARYEWYLTQPLTSKVSFVTGVDLFGAKYYLGAGFFHTRDPPAASALCETCEARYSMPCAIGNALTLSAHAEVELLTVTETGFAELGTDPYRMDGGFGVLVVDFENKTVMADSLDATTWGASVADAFQSRAIDNADAAHDQLVELANRGGGWTHLTGTEGETDFVGFVSKVNKFAREYYLLSGYRRERAPTNEECSAEYAQECSEINAKSLVGSVVTEIQLAASDADLVLLLDAINDPLDDSFKVAPDFHVVVLDQEFRVLALEDGAERPDWSTIVAQENYVSFVQQAEAVSSLGNDFESELRTHAFQVGGGSFEVTWNDAYGHNKDKIIFAQAAKRPAANGDELTYYVFTMFTNAPAPSLCTSGCPENAFCSASDESVPARCECGFYYIANYVNGSATTCEDTLTNTLRMECVVDAEKESVKSVKTIAYSLGSLNLIFATACIVWTVVMRQHAIVRVSQPMLLGLVGAGTLVSSVTIFMMTIDDFYGPAAWGGANEMANTACMAQPWFYGLGFALTYCSMIVKLRRVARVFKSAASLKKAKGVSLRVTLGFLVGLISVEAFILALWTLLDPLKFVRDPEDPLNGSCQSPMASKFVGLLAANHLGLLFYGANLSYQCRKVNGVFAETKYLSLAMIGNLQVLLLALPVIVLTADDTTTSMFIRSIAVFLNDFSTTALIFLPKMYFAVYGAPQSSGTGTSVLNNNRNSNGKRPVMSKSVAPTSTGSSYVEG